MATSGTVNTNAFEVRYYRVTWSASQSISDNKSTISWTLSAVGGDGIYYAERTLTVVVAGSTVYNKTARVERYPGTIASGTVAVSHDANGDASFSIGIQAAVYYSTVNCTGSSSFALDNIPRKSTLSVANGTLNTAQTLTVTRKSTSFTHTIVALCGTASTTICDKSSSTSISFTPPLAWASQDPNSTTLAVTYTITTYNGSTSIGSNNYPVTCAVPSSVKPSCTVAVSDPTGYLSTYGGYVKNKSKLKVVVTPTISYGSAIASYSTTANESTYTTASFTTEVLKSSGTASVNAKVTDKRGRSGTATASITVLDYSPPAITNLRVHRINDDGSANDQGDYAQVKFDASVTSLSSKNTATYKLEYKKKSDSTYTSVTLTTLANKYSVTDGVAEFAADTGSSYDIRITVTDAFGSDSKSTTVSTASTIMHWLASGLGMAIGKVAEIAGIFEVAWETRIRNILCIGEKNGYMDGKTGIYLHKDGYMHLQRASSNGNPYIGFFIDTQSSAADGSIYVGGSDGYMHFANADRYVFDKAVTINGIVYPGNNKVLWNGAWYMAADHTATLNEAISKQQNGIVLIWSVYANGTAQDYNFYFTFVPKYFVSAKAGRGVYSATIGQDVHVSKYVYINDTTIVGYSGNNSNDTVHGVTLQNNSYVLRYVIGV